MDLKFATAVNVARAVKLLIKIKGGGATAAPGLAAQTIDPNALGKLSKFFLRPVLVTGTNGKTTTSRLVGRILDQEGEPFIHNRSGSNLLRGLIGSLIDNLGSGREQKTPLLEVDEATLPQAINGTYPRVVVFTNLFRDQLDRYGEVDTIRKMWVGALGNLDSSTTLVLNADDHSIAHLGSDTKAKKVYFGIEDTHLSIGSLPHASDFTSCIQCNKELVFDTVYMSHLGKYRCASCGLKRPKPAVFAKRVELDESKGASILVETPKGVINLRIALPGLYNVYNTLAAVSVGLDLGLRLESIEKALNGAQAPFGRAETIQLADGKKLSVFLVKNPVGFNEVIRAIFSTKEKKNVLIAINDLLADGTDVSWLWDVDFELLTRKTRKIWISGQRAADMALRLKYANLETDLVEEDLSKCLETAVEEIQVGTTLYVFPTYTAMMTLRKFLAERGLGQPFWQD
jgi:UDP-N-acetylmuramyl tripeptide synthase